LNLDVSIRELLFHYPRLLTFVDIFYSTKSTALFYLYNYSISLILANFANVEIRQFFALLLQLIALRSITFTLRCQRVVLVVCLRCHVPSYNVVLMKFPWKFDFYLLIQVAVPHSELLHLKLLLFH
jgi:hypothetical protein